MKPSEALEKHRDDIRRLTLSRRAANPRVFGFAVRGEDGEGSDLDIIVDTVSGEPRRSILAAGPRTCGRRSASPSTW
jgi:predicted nucleotidyltransferase